MSLDEDEILLLAKYGIRSSGAGRRLLATTVWPAIWMGVTCSCSAEAADDVPGALRPWLGPQRWERDTEGPVIALGRPGDFDDTHVFAPCVALEGEKGDRSDLPERPTGCFAQIGPVPFFALWYCGSPGTVRERVFRLGLATSRDGRQFDKSPSNPVFAFGDGKHSVLTPALLRSPDGSVLRHEGKLRLWFSATHFAGPTGLHTLHETTSTDGVDWQAPSPAQLEHAYAPTVIREGDVYRLWYTDVSADPWIFRHAASRDGRRWRVTPDPVLVIDQAWERDRLVYPTVLKSGGVYLMWYGSYWSEHASKTAIGFAASIDGLRWHKSPHNPVLRPDPRRPWESHYTTSQSVLRLDDGSFRIWYASRKEPPFLNKYFAINTARWTGPSTD